MEVLNEISNKLPDKRAIIRSCIHTAFNNSLVQKLGDYLIENGRLSDFRDKLIPLFEASEAVRDRISEIVERLGIIKDKPINFRNPRRLQNPNPTSFQEKFHSNYDEKEKMPDEINLLFCNASRYRDFDPKKERAKVDRYRMGFLPQGANPILEAATPNSIDNVPIRVTDMDDKVGNGINIKKIISHAMKNPNKKVVVCLTSIQTNQFTRAYDVALELKAIAIQFGLDIDIFMGGPHVSSHPESVIKLTKIGIIPVSGEIEEGRWQQILADVLHDKAQNSYSFPLVKNISDIPLQDPTARDGYASPFVQMQWSRGCPYKCDFCSIIGFEGRKMRYKSPEEVEVMFRAAIEKKMQTLFITDNNFLRNKHCRKILRMMAKVKKETGSDINIMFQSDLNIAKDDGSIDTDFMDLCRDAGVLMIFFGQESMEPKVLIESMDKRQNLIHIAKSKGKKINQIHKQDIVDYTKEVVLEWHKRGVAVNCTCIIGLDGDKRGVGEETAKLLKEMDVDIVSPFIYTLLPGSKDWQRFVESENAKANRKKAGMKLVDITPNNADSTHPNVEFENGLNADQQTKEYLELLRTFYRLSYIKDRKMNPSVLSYYLMHCLSAALGEHPMSMGILRKEKTEREPTLLRRYRLETFIKAASSSKNISFDKAKGLINTLQEDENSNKTFSKSIFKSKKRNLPVRI